MKKLIKDLISVSFCSIVRKGFTPYDATYIEISSLSSVKELKLTEDDIRSIVEHIYAIRIGYQHSI